MNASKENEGAFDRLLSLKFRGGEMIKKMLEVHSKFFVNAGL